MSRPAYPPDYIKLPVAVARAAVHDSLIVTMARIVGLCWDHRQRRSPAYTQAELVKLLARPRTTLDRHLGQLRQLGWLEVVRRDRRLVLRPLVQGAGQPAREGLPGGGKRDEVQRALQEAGITDQSLGELLQRDLCAVDVRAWFLWSCAGEQAWLKNPAGYIVSRLRRGDPPPPEYVELAGLTAEEVARIRQASSNGEHYQDWPSLDDRLARLAPLWLSSRAGQDRGPHRSGRAARD